METKNDHPCGILVKAVADVQKHFRLPKLIKFGKEKIKRPSVPAFMSYTIDSIRLMADELNNLEYAILERISDDYSILKFHIPFLKVESREKTGVGMYVHFNYNPMNEAVPLIPGSYHHLSSNALLKVEGLDHGLAYEISITDGLIDILELVTYGNEVWDGQISCFWFEN